MDSDDGNRSGEEKGFLGGKGADVTKSFQQNTSLSSHPLISCWCRGQRVWVNQLWAQDRAEKGRQWIWRGKQIIRTAGVEHERGVYRGWEGVGSR